MEQSSQPSLRIGVLALQGAFIEHIKQLWSLGVEGREVRLPADLDGLDGLIIPGGESTTIGKLAVTYGLMAPLRAFARQRPVWGTCAGMIFMARDIGRDQPLLGLMDIEVERNAFGRQVDSFEIDLTISGVAGDGLPPFHAVFIRAPRLVAAGDGVQTLSSLPDGTIVAARENDWLVTSFHPELTADPRLHRYFVEMVRNAAPQT
jgi:5'-phosphate synthase pdxT subunit